VKDGSFCGASGLPAWVAAAHSRGRPVGGGALGSGRAQLLRLLLTGVGGGACYGLQASVRLQLRLRQTAASGGGGGSVPALESGRASVRAAAAPVLQGVGELGPRPRGQLCSLLTAAAVVGTLLYVTTNSSCLLMYCSTAVAATLLHGST